MIAEIRKNRLYIPARLCSDESVRVFVFCILLLPVFCREPLNNPYGSLDHRAVHYLPLSDDPRTLDPVRATDSVSFSIISNIHVTAYEYDYHARPLKLVPLLARDMPEEKTVLFEGRPVHAFRFRIRKGLYYAPDFCSDGRTGPEVTADDVIFTIKRTADRSLSPYAYPLLERIIGFHEYSDQLEKRAAARDQTAGMIDSDPDRYQGNIRGISRFDDDGIQILLEQPDLQLIYFFAIPSSAPLSEACYRRMVSAGRSLEDGIPASGAFYIRERRLQSHIILARNPGYAGFQRYTVSEERGEEELPLLEEVHLTEVKSGPTLWRLFLQGYMDRISLGQDTFDQVFEGHEVTERFRKQGIYSDRENELVTYGLLFNLNDPVVGPNVWLRRAVACSFRIDDLISRFYRNRAIPATGLIPPGMEGGEERAAMSDSEAIAAQKRACQCSMGVPALLEKAGYPGGIDPQTGNRLTLRMIDVARSGGTAIYRFYTESAESNGWNLKIDVFDAPTYFEKRMKKEFQITTWGWGADYADPQNFYQLFYGPNRSGTLNESSYDNPEFDALYREILSLPPGPERQRRLRSMDAILKRDVPIILSHHPVLYSISWPYLDPIIPHPVSFNQLKYRRVHPELRRKIVKALNPVFGGGF